MNVLRKNVVEGPDTPFDARHPTGSECSNMRRSVVTLSIRHM